MKLTSPQTVHLLLVLLIVLIGALAHEQAVKDGAGEQQRARAQRPLVAHSEAQDGQKSRLHDADTPGSSAFEEASVILRRIKPSTSRLAKLNKSSGTLGTIAYYGRELFHALFMNGPPENDLVSTQTPAKRLNKHLAQAVKLLEDSASQGNPDAIYLLAEMNFFGNYSHPRNYSEASRRYHELAAMNGNSSAQHMLGFMHATGIGGAVKQDQAKALLYYTFAAEAEDARSQMTVAFRHHTGIGTPRNCDEAVHWYKRVADKAIAFMRSGPPGGHYMYKKSYRIADTDGGVYGEGASVSSSGPNAKMGGPNSDAYAAFEDVLEYLELMHRKGDLKATFSLGQLYYDGSRELRQDFVTAKSYFYGVARSYWGKDGKIKPDVPPVAEKLASKAAGYIGRMWLRGEGVAANYDIAQTWFKRGIANGDALCQYQMGLMHLHGLGVPKDAVKAADYFAPAADQDMAAAQVKLGALFLDQGDVSTASKYFDLASRNGHIEAYYYLADLAYQGLGRDKSCGVAALYYKIVAEKAEIILSSFVEANSAYEAGDMETALVDYMMAAEQGFEVGQANVAYLLDQARPRFPWNSLLPSAKRKASSISTNDELALIYWTRSAKQMNIDSTVKMGDYYLEGLGTAPDQEKAAACYQAAAETMQCAQAMWNLGWMHENGIGMEQDFHLAKRYYDLALETTPREAYLPVTLALYKLRIRSWWNDVTNGKVKSIQNEPEPDNEWSFSDWFATFLEAGDAYYDDHDHFEPDDWDTTHDGMPGGDDYYDDIDDGILESLLIVALAALLAFLVYYRQQRQMANRRNQEQQQQQQQDRGPEAGQQNQAQQQDRGLFPGPDDPEFANWAAGGIGH